MTTRLELLYDQHRDNLLTMSENNHKLLTVATGRDSNGNWVIISRKRYNEIKQQNEETGNSLIQSIL
jgi:hypothetical protein